MIVSRNKRELDRVILKLEQEKIKRELKINGDKTKYMHRSRKYRKIESLTYERYTFNEIETFK